MDEGFKFSYACQAVHESRKEWLHSENCYTVGEGIEQVIEVLQNVTVHPSFPSAAVQTSTQCDIITTKMFSFHN